MVDSRRPTESLSSEAGSQIIELIAWLALVMLPLLALTQFAIDVETRLSAAQNIARVLARNASLGLPDQTAQVVADYGGDAGAYQINLETLEIPSHGSWVKANVSVVRYAFLPTVSAQMKLQTQ